MRLRRAIVALVQLSSVNVEEPLDASTRHPVLR